MFRNFIEKTARYRYQIPFYFQPMTAASRIQKDGDAKWNRGTYWSNIVCLTGKV